MAANIDRLSTRFLAERAGPLAFANYLEKAIRTQATDKTVSLYATSFITFIATRKGRKDFYSERIIPPSPQQPKPSSQQPKLSVEDCESIKIVARALQDKFPKHLCDFEAACRQLEYAPSTTNNSQQTIAR